MNIYIKSAAAQDLPGILEIVNHNILTSTAVYDYDPKSMKDLEEWLQDKLKNNWPVIVAVYGATVLGYGTYGTFRFKEGFKYTVEHSVYVSHEYTGGGIGKLLLAELIRMAKEEGYHIMIGGIDADNKSSIAFHEKFGFATTGLLKEVGFKFGRWLDVQFMQLSLE